MEDPGCCLAKPGRPLKVGPAAGGAQGIPRVAAPGRAVRPAALPARTAEPGPGRLWPSSSETKGGGARAENLISLLGR